jgi:hypothetical protein
LVGAAGVSQLTSIGNKGGTSLMGYKRRKRRRTAMRKIWLT